MQEYGRRYPHAGYGGAFRHWLRDDNPQPVMGMPTSEDGLLLSIRPAKEETSSPRLPPTRQQRIFRRKNDRKARLLVEDEKETAKWQKMGAALSKLANESWFSRLPCLCATPTDVIPGADDDDLGEPVLIEPVLICDDFEPQVLA